MSQDQFKLSKPWNESKFEGILVRISEHTDSERYGWMADLINSKFPDAKISVEDMCRQKFFVDSNTKDEMAEDIIDKVKKWYARYIFDLLGGRGSETSVENFVNLCTLAFKFSKQSKKDTWMTDRNAFNKAYMKYMGKDVCEDVFVYDCFLFYLNPSAVRTPDAKPVDLQDFALFKDRDVFTSASSSSQFMWNVCTTVYMRLLKMLTLLIRQDVVLFVVKLGILLLIVNFSRVIYAMLIPRF